MSYLSQVTTMSGSLRQGVDQLCTVHFSVQPTFPSRRNFLDEGSGVLIYSLAQLLSAFGKGQLMASLVAALVCALPSCSAGPAGAALS